MHKSKQGAEGDGRNDRNEQPGRMSIPPRGFAGAPRLPARRESVYQAFHNMNGSGVKLPLAINGLRFLIFQKGDDILYACCLT